MHTVSFPGSNNLNFKAQAKTCNPPLISLYTVSFAGPNRLKLNARAKPCNPRLSSLISNSRLTLMQVGPALRQGMNPEPKPTAHLHMYLLYLSTWHGPPSTMDNYRWGNIP